MPLPLAVSIGEPGGIGPDIAIMAWQQLRDDSSISFCVVGDPEVLIERAMRLNTDCPVQTVSSLSGARLAFADGLPVLDKLVPIKDCVPGRFQPAHAKAVLHAIELACDLALSGDAAGVVTCPIQKESLYAAGFQHQGHTDFIADLARKAGHRADPVMMLVADNLRTVPLTVHIPLKDVPAAITERAISRTVKTMVHDLVHRFGIEQPRIAVAGLNPHAGEGATLGTEERDIIGPAIKQLASDGFLVDGPYPADTMFHDDARNSRDAVLCMYHDQALIPVKTIGFHDGVNTTLGLPFVRTSPDHGTALSLAGTGKANPSSMIAAIRLAARLSNPEHG